MATVSDNVQLITTANYAKCRISVRSLAQAVVVGSSIVVSGNRVYAADTDGNFSMVLAAGDYEVIFNGTDRFTITVPTGTAGHSFRSLITSNVTEPGPLSQTPWPVFPVGARWVVFSDGRMYAKNLTTGKYHEVTVDGDDEAPYMQMATPGAALPT